MPRILFAGVDDHLSYILEQLSKEGHVVKPASDLMQAIEHMDRDRYDVVVTGSSVLESERRLLMNHVAKKDYPTRFIVLSDSGENMNKPNLNASAHVDVISDHNDAKTCLNSINRLLSEKDDNIEQVKTTPRLSEDFQFYDFVGESESICKISLMVSKVSGTDSTVLITGESGTGKELIARALHKNSPRRESPMIIINCGSIPGELLESELFGHEKGAFTGAHRTRIGRFELADGGTIFLDEIGDMSPDLQVKLLRVIQEKCFERVGGARSIQVDVRIISATNKDLKKAILDNSFREDLFYRLNVIPIQVPPLRKRKTDIPLLIDFFIKKLHEKNRWGIKRFSELAMSALCRYDWSGNVRELENLMERISVLVEKDIVDIDDLPDYISGAEFGSAENFQPVSDFFENGMGFNEAVEDHQKKLILHALNKTNWVKAKAAEMLKMKRTTLVEKIKKMNLEPDQADGDDSDPED